jgi:hypothetical protein
MCSMVFLNACEPVKSPNIDSAEVPVQQGQGSLAHTRRMSKVGAACSMCCTVDTVDCWNLTKLQHQRRPALRPHLAQWPQRDAIQIAGETETDCKAQRGSGNLRESFSASDQLSPQLEPISTNCQLAPCNDVPFCKCESVWRCGSCQQGTLRHLKHHE